MVLAATLTALLVAVAASAVARAAPLARTLWAQRTRARLASGVGVAAALGGLVLLAAWLRWTLVVPRHVMYIDEPWYAEAASSLLSRGRAELCQQTWSGLHCVPYPKSLGWPVVLAWVFAARGVSDMVAIRTATALGVLTVALVAVGGRLAGGRWSHGLAAALLVALCPAHIAWSATAETNVAGAAWLIAGLCGALAYDSDDALASAVLAGAALALAAATRPEAAVAFLPVVALLARRGTGRARVVATSIAIGGGLIGAAAAMPMWTLNREISGGTFLAVASIPANLRALLQPPGAAAFYGGLVLLAAGGAVALARAGRGTAAWLLGSTAVLQAVIALAFHRFSDRMLLGALVCLAPLAGAVGAVVPASRHRVAHYVPDGIALVAAALVGWLARPAYATFARTPESQLLETRLPALAASVVRAPDALVVTEWPTVVASTTRLPVMATREALARGEAQFAALAARRAVYFVCDMFCEARSPTGTGDCGRVLRGLALEPVATTDAGRRRYGIYRVRGRARQGDAPPQCPFVQP